MVDGDRQRFALEPSIITREEAEEWLFRFKADDDALVLRNFITAYLQERRPQLSEKTIESYRDSLRAFESHFGVARKINTITAREVMAWASSMLDQGLKPVSVNVALRSVKAAFNRAVTWDLISKAPRIEMVKTPKHQPRHLSDAQMEAILKHETHPEYRRLWLFMVWTAVRRGEALGLEWERVSLGDRPQALVCGKGDKERMVPLLPPAVEALGAPGLSGPVFNVGQADYVTHRFHKVAQAAGVKAKLHDLRHTGLTWMVARGVPLKLVQDIAGHTSITTTMGYAKTFAGGAYDVLMKAFSF